ncbi:hypothetical protein CBR_g17119 [Chara braunii]|uniref:Uncharacterized protein n=1 Tax=Chara braunii TaxID=69332 RepID=A0A388KUP2_CHABU|nr:hypothetical protein CBR_g17119 [Chara braunii]|eukprot:GBG73780.1 hypothetical protein CBR_g17119 [Chara braunii]
MQEDLNSRWEMVCDKIDQKDKVSNEVAILREEVARMSSKKKAAKTSSSVAKPVSRDDVVERLKREQEDLRAVADRRFVLLEERLSELTEAKEEAEASAELWKAEALRPGNKRGSIAVGQTPVSHARVRQRSTPATLPTEPRVNQQFKGIVERHNMEVNFMKELRLKDVNERLDAEKEVERLKEVMAKLEMEKERGSNLKSRLDEVAGHSAKKVGCSSVKKKSVDTPGEEVNE